MIPNFVKRLAMLGFRGHAAHSRPFAPFRGGLAYYCRQRVHRHALFFGLRLAADWQEGDAKQTGN
jgi:hypothetical protein